jgi:hypothetical protein
VNETIVNDKRTADKARARQANVLAETDGLKCISIGCRDRQHEPVGSFTRRWLVGARSLVPYVIDGGGWFRRRP